MLILSKDILIHYIVNEYIEDIEYNIWKKMMRSYDFQTISFNLKSQKQPPLRSQFSGLKATFQPLNSKPTFITSINLPKHKYSFKNQKPIKIQQPTITNLKKHKKKIDENTINLIYKSIVNGSEEKALTDDEIKQMTEKIKKSKNNKGIKIKESELNVIEVIQNQLKQKHERQELWREVDEILDKQKKKPLKKRHGEFPNHFKQNTISRLLDYLSDDDDIFNQIDTIEMLRKALNPNEKQEQKIEEVDQGEDSNPSQSSISDNGEEVKVNLPGTHRNKPAATNNRQLLEDLIKWKNTLVDMMRRI